MKKIIFTILCLFLSTVIVYADTYVNGYYRKDGTYVKPHYRSDRNSSKFDNWSTKGNVNPYTGKKGYKDPYGSGSYSSFGSKSKKKSYWGY